MLILLAATLAAPLAADPPVVPARCTPVTDKASASARVGVRKLGELPPGQQIKAVWRFDENGCPRPVIVRAEVGNNGR